MAKLYFVAPLEFEASENPITLGDNKFQAELPFDAEILGSAQSPAIEGCIQQAGAGAGTATQFQLRVVETNRNLLSTPVEFNVDDADGNGRAPLSSGQLTTRPRAQAGQHVAMDCDGLPGGANSSQAVVTVWCAFRYEVE